MGYKRDPLAVYEDSGGCEMRFDVEDLCKYFMLEMKPERYGEIAN